ncbi:MAG TPA: nuclear transport factor 2 family protein [Gemmatimonadaceae bacterium]
MNMLLVAVLCVAAPQDADTRALLRLEDDWARALVKRDTVVFARLLAAGFVYTEDDKTMDRATVLHEVGSGSDTVTAAHNEDMQVHRFGATALVTGWLIVQGRGSNGAFDRRYRFTDTWVKGDGRWQIVGAQDYLVPCHSGES